MIVFITLGLSLVALFLAILGLFSCHAQAMHLRDLYKRTTKIHQTAVTARTKASRVGQRVTRMEYAAK